MTWRESATSPESSSRTSGISFRTVRKQTFSLRVALRASRRVSAFLTVVIFLSYRLDVSAGRKVTDLKLPI